MTGCWLAANAVHERGPMPPCEGRLVKVHLIPRQLIRKERPAGLAWCDDRDGWVDAREEFAVADGNPLMHIPLDELLADPRGYVWACGGIMGDSGHHGAVDTARTLRIPRARLPLAVEEFADDLELIWWLDRTYGPAMTSCEACDATWEPAPVGDPGCPSCQTANVVRVAGEL